MDIILILYMRTLRPQEVKKVSEGHADSRQQIWDSALPVSKHMLLVWNQMASLGVPSA